MIQIFCEIIALVEIKNFWCGEIGFEKLFVVISTYRPHETHSRVDWLWPITDENFPRLNKNFIWKLSRHQPTRLLGTRARLVDISSDTENVPFDIFEEIIRVEFRPVSHWCHHLDLIISRVTDIYERNFQIRFGWKLRNQTLDKYFQDQPFWNVPLFDISWRVKNYGNGDICLLLTSGKCGFAKSK